MPFSGLISIKIGKPLWWPTKMLGRRPAMYARPTLAFTLLM
jgi:hypothetical protein